MKPKSILATGLLVITTALLAGGVQADPDTNTSAASQTPAMGTQGNKVMKPHSHVEEKTGIPQKAPETKDQKPEPTKDKNRHLHLRDGK